MDLFLAVDGGQTTTKVALADEHGRILAQTTGGPSDHTEEPGGWGHLFGDEGSAFWIAREAIRAIAAELDGLGGPTSLTPMFLNRLGVPSAYKLMEKYYSGEWSRDHMAGLAVWVNEAAVAGDR